MREHHKIMRAAALLLCFFAALLAVQTAVKALEKVLYPRRYSQPVQQYAAQYGVDENLVYAIIRTESGFDKKARSDVNARGLMQITEETFDWIKTKIAPDETMTFEDLDTPEVNIRFGSYLLSTCLLRYAGDVKTAAAAYHSGMGTVDALLKSGDYSADGTVLTAFPYRQMSNYVNKVSRSYEKYQTLYGA
ncbi:MAG: lytic transglycosylase domain-containing protein [Ruthenibacterium sp.]